MDYSGRTISEATVSGIATFKVDGHFRIGGSIDLRLGGEDEGSLGPTVQIGLTVPGEPHIGLEAAQVALLDAALGVLARVLAEPRQRLRDLMAEEISLHVGQG